MMPGQRVIPGRATRARDRNMRHLLESAWDKGRDDRLAGRASTNNYIPGSEAAARYDAAYRLSAPSRARATLPARRTPGPRQSLAQLAGAMCQLAEFRLWLGAADADEAAIIVRARCGVQSRRELDTNPTAARLFHDRVRGPFAASRES